MSLLAAFIEHPALWPAPHLKLYACPLRDYPEEPCPTPLRRSYTTPKCRTHGAYMLPVRERRRG